MAGLNYIKTEAMKEDNSIAVEKEVDRIQMKLEASEEFDINVPYELVDQIEGYLDAIGIPCYNVAENTLSVAKTYNKLYYREKYR
jgi:hypothetical protein